MTTQVVDAQDRSALNTAYERMKYALGVVNLATRGYGVSTRFGFPNAPLGTFLSASRGRAGNPGLSFYEDQVMKFGGLRVFRSDGKGGGWHEPPYTWEEEMDFYRRMNAGPMTMYWGSRGPTGKLNRTADNLPQQKSRRRATTMDRDEEDLEKIIADLIERKYAAPEGIAAYPLAVRELPAHA